MGKDEERNEKLVSSFVLCSILHYLSSVFLGIVSFVLMKMNDIITHAEKSQDISKVLDSHRSMKIAKIPPVLQLIWISRFQGLECSFS